MKLILATLLVAVAVGYLAGGRLSKLGRLHVRWPAMAMAGLGLQVAPVPGKTLPMVLLLGSFLMLFVFAVINLRIAGFALILTGIALNFTVIAVNDGMPVTRHALVASGQSDTLRLLIRDGGAKHHLAAADDRLMFLGDVIAIRPIRQAVSLGDLFTYGGVAWLVVAAMLGRAAPAGHRGKEPVDAVPSTEVRRVGG